MKQYLFLLLVVIFTLSFAACSNESGTLPAKNKSDITISNETSPKNTTSAVQGESTIKTGELENILKETLEFQFANGKVWYLAHSGDKYYVGSFRPDGSDIKTINLQTPKDTMYIDFYAADDDSVWLIHSKVQGNTSATLFHLDSNGNELLKTIIEKNPVEICIDTESNVYVAYELESGNKIVVLNSQGEKKFELPVDLYPSFLRTSDNKVNVISYLDNRLQIQGIDSAQNNYSGNNFENVTQDMCFSQCIKGSDKYSFYVIMDDNLVGYNSQTKKMEDVFCFNDYGIPNDETTSVLAVWPVEKGKYICIIETEKAVELKEIQI